MFIVFEGPKYTGIGRIVDRFDEDMIDEYMIYFTKEPGGPDNGKKIRDILNNKRLI